jgi:hypothetical protein
MALASALLLQPAAAQSPQRIIGLTANAPSVLSQDFNTCAPAQCSPAGFPGVASPFHGGSAHDPRTRGLWISEGLRIAKVDPRNQCIYQCPPMAMPNTTAGNEVTGLAFNERTRTLWVTDASGIIRWYTEQSCQLSLVSRCIAPINPGEILTGCATDDVNDLLFWCAVDPAVPGGTVYIAKQSDPCNPFCKFPVQRCGANQLGPLRGLAYDACRRTVWATDGRLSVRLFVDPNTCTTSEVQCCANPTPDPYVGLCVLPATERLVGGPCTSPVCPACPGMVHSLVGDATVGNPAFAWSLTGAPANALVLMMLNVGSCTPPGVTPLGFCGPLLVPLAPPPVFAGPLPTGGGAGCTGGVTLPFPLPNNPALCGLPIATQFAGWCVVGAGVGTFVSNCVSALISAS